MVDSVKNYGLAGTSANIELGKGGPRMIGSSDNFSLMADNTNFARAAISDGSNADHAVTKSQLEGVEQGIARVTKGTVSFDSGTVTIGTTDSNTFIHSVTIEKGAGNWNGANSTTEITVGDDGDTDRLFAGFDPTVQCKSNEFHHYTSATAIKAYVTQGGASAGTATILITFSGNID